MRKLLPLVLLLVGCVGDPIEPVCYDVQVYGHDGEIVDTYRTFEEPVEGRQLPPGVMYEIAWPCGAWPA